MTPGADPGLGELLRHLVELTDANKDGWYRAQGLAYRPRYTPVMRALASGPATVTDIQEKLSVTQGAVSQTLKLMQEDGLIEKRQGRDARQSIVSLTTQGRSVLHVLQPHWEATFAAIGALEKDIRLPLMTCLRRAVDALEQQSLAERIEEAARTTGGSPADTPAYNPFASGGERYSKFRPTYPEELARSLAALASKQNVALDVGCGNGQLTSLLAPHFDEVIGMDPSASQLRHARAVDNVTYLQRGAEELGLPASSVDLIAVAQAAHWFDLDAFYAEARRVARQDAAIALVSYGVPYIADSVNAVFQKGYWQDVHEFWPPERSHVESGYGDLFFPFSPIEFPSCSCRAEMNVGQFINYMTTWSAYKNAHDRGAADRFDRFFDTLVSAWPENAAREVVWPVSVRAARIHPAPN